MEKIYEEIIKQYDSLVLTPKLGNGQLRDEFITGLEKVLGSIKPLKNVKVGNPSLDRPIDYQDLKEYSIAMGHNKGIVNHACKALWASLKNTTYKDLLDQYEKNRSSGLKNNFEHYISRYRNVGRVTSEILADYFSSIDERFE